MEEAPAGGSPRLGDLLASWVVKDPGGDGLQQAVAQLGQLPGPN